MFFLGNSQGMSWKKFREINIYTRNMQEFSFFTDQSFSLQILLGTENRFRIEVLKL